MAHLRDDAPPMYVHQTEALEWVARHGSYIEGDPMGAGKTRIALADFARIAEAKPSARMLVVAKKDLLGWHRDPELRENWSAEIPKWTTFDFAAATGTAKQRLAGIEARKPITLIAYDNLWRNLTDLNAVGYDYVVYDEAHKLKGRKSQRTQAAFNLRATKRAFLTGSPLLNKVDELWPLLFLCDPSRFPNYWSFVNRYAVFGGYQDKQIIGVQNEAELRAILRQYMIRRDGEVIKADLTKRGITKTVIKRWCELEKTVQRPLYDRIKDELELEWGDRPLEEIGNPMTRTLRLRQAIATPAHFGKPDKSAKLDLAEEVLDEIGPEWKVVIGTNHIPAVAAMCQRMDNLGISYVRFTGHEKDAQRAENKSHFQNIPINKGGPQVLIATYPVVTEGHNLYAANYAIKLDKLYVPKLDEQFEDRLWRPGQLNPVTIIELHARHTVEQRIERILATKRSVFDTVVNEDDFEAGLRAALADSGELLSA